MLELNAIAAITKFTEIHFRNEADGQRFGQRFVNAFIKRPWPDLFHASHQDAWLMIHSWLCDHQYFDELPPVVNPVALGENQ